jgi:predicted RND superfamily exporter protein
MGIATILLIFGVFGLMNQRTNYDMMSYLSGDMDSGRGFQILNEDFGLGNAMQVFIRGESDVSVASLTEQLRDIEGVDAVHWVTDFAPIEQPREFLDETVTDNYYAADGTLVQIGFAGSMNDRVVKNAIQEIRSVLEPYDVAFSGTQLAELEEAMSRDQLRLIAAPLVLVTVVLLLTIPSITVPFLFVLTIGAAVVMNLGLNYYLSQEVFYLTAVIVFALQFAVTMDYALFLYHRFEEERQDKHAEEAMIASVAATSKAVVTAALTTIAGFLALTVMQLQFGMDLGLTLARGVVITLMLVIGVLPGLLIEALPVIDRVRHRGPQFDFSRVGRFVAKHAGVVAVVAFVLIALGVFANSRVITDYSLNSVMPEDLPSVSGEKQIAEAFGREDTLFLVLEDTGSPVDLERLHARVEDIAGVDRVFGFTSLVDPRIPSEFLPAEATDTFFSGGYTYLMIDVAYDPEDPRSNGMLKQINDTAGAEWPGLCYLTGFSVLMGDIERVSAGDTNRINIISIVAIVVILAVAYRSLAVPVALVAAIELAIVANMSFELAGSGRVIFFASLAIGAIQLGATVDYAVLITTRYQEELMRTRHRVESIKIAVSESSQSILVSAATMFAATIPLATLSSISTIRELTLLIARGALVSFVAVVVFLPSFLVVGQPLFERLSIGWPKHAEKGE